MGQLNIHDLLRTPPFFPDDERMRDVYYPSGRKEPRSAEPHKEDKSKEKGAGFLRKLMAGWQGLQEGGIPGAYFGVADYDENQRARQQQASMEMQKAIAGIENTRAKTKQSRAAGRSSDASTRASWLEANRAEALHPGEMRAQSLKNVGEGIENDTGSYNLSRLPEETDAGNALKESQARYQDWLGKQIEAKHRRDTEPPQSRPTECGRGDRAVKRRVSECRGA